MELQCAPVPPKAQYTEASVVETDTCNYKLTLKSIAGCPTSCVTGTNVCSGNGICGFDTDSQSSRCFCYTGYQGGTCGEGAAASGGMSAEGIILIVVCIVLAGVLGVVAFMMLKLRKLQVDPAAYGELQGRCEYNAMRCDAIAAAACGAEPAASKLVLLLAPVLHCRDHATAAPNTCAHAVCPLRSLSPAQSTSWVCSRKRAVEPVRRLGPKPSRAPPSAPRRLSRPYTRMQHCKHV